MFVQQLFTVLAHSEVIGIRGHLISSYLDTAEPHTTPLQIFAYPEHVQVDFPV